MNPFKRKKEKFPTTPAPRTIPEISKEYSELVAKAGEKQYLVKVYNDELAYLNKELVRVNTEAKQRQDLDKAAKAAETTPEVKNEQV